jgi:hypothetical protein
MSNNPPTSGKTTRKGSDKYFYILTLFSQFSQTICFSSFVGNNAAQAANK